MKVIKKNKQLGLKSLARFFGEDFQTIADLLGVELDSRDRWSVFDVAQLVGAPIDIQYNSYKIWTRLRK